MPMIAVPAYVRSDNSDVATEMELLSLRTQELYVTMNKIRLEESVAVTQHQRERERLTMQYEEDRKLREHALKPQVLEALKLKLELAKTEENTEKLRKENLASQHAENCLEREHKERDNRLEREHRERDNCLEREHRQESIRLGREHSDSLEAERAKRREEQEKQRREEIEQDALRLRKAGLVAAGVGTASGAIGGVLGTTATFGLAAGVAGAAAVLAPVSGTVAILTGAGYVYKKVTSSNTA